MSKYIKELEKLSLKLENLKKYAIENNFTSIEKKCSEVKEQISKNQFIITVVGEFNRGKSTFINALLGVDIIPTAIRPTTATINIIHYGESPSIRVHKSNGDVIPLEFSTSALTDYTSLVDFAAKTVKYIEIAYPLEYLKDGTTIVDTPGVNDMDEQRLEVTYGYMPNSDAVIFLFDIETPFKQSEKNFLKERILSNNISQLFFVANKSDRVEPDEIDESVNEIKKHLSILFPEKEFDVYPLSAKTALNVKIDKEVKDSSSELYNVFEQELKNFILGSKKFELKLQNFKNQYEAIISLFAEDIKIELDNLSLSIEELFEKKEKIKISEGKYNKAFEKLLKYIDEQSSSFKRRIESSLLKDYRSKEEAFLHSIDLQKGNLAEYSEKVLNYEIEKSLKNWVEQSQPYIDQNIKIIISKTLEGYKKYFSKMPLLNNLKSEVVTAYNKIESIELSEKYNLDNIGKGSFAAGALLLGGLSIMTGGLSLMVLVPALVGGKAGENYIIGRYSKKQHDEQRRELLAKFPEILANAYEMLRQQTVQSINSTFSDFKKSLSDDFEKTFEELKESIDKNLSIRDKEKDTIEQKKIKLTELFEIISKKVV